MHQLRPEFRELFTSALLEATSSTNAWIVTGGTNAGIMKLVGDALAERKQVETCLGIATWGVIHGREDLTMDDEDDHDPDDQQSQAEKRDHELLDKLPTCTVRFYSV